MNRCIGSTSVTATLMVQPIRCPNNELNSLKELKMTEVRFPVEELLELITESLFEAEAKMQNGQEQKNKKKMMNSILA